MRRPQVLVLCLGVSLTMVGCSRLADHPLVREAVEEVSVNVRVARALGTPVKCSRKVTGSANEIDGIAMVQFEATGPKGKGIVAIEGKKTRDEWGVTHLELRPAGGEVLKLTADLEARTGTDTPRFDPGASRASRSFAPPPGDVEIVLPPGPPGQ
jgi:hypothetical protein